MKRIALVLATLILCSSWSWAQWRNRYPKVDGYGHHVYLEGYELPIMNGGPTDPAPSPDGNQVAFAAKGWLWLMDLPNGVATRITFSGGMDSRPNWSPDGKQLVFVRDEGDDTHIVLLDLVHMNEYPIIDTKAIDLDPIFSADGKMIYYASASLGSFDLYKYHIADQRMELISETSELERLPNPSSDGSSIVYLKKSGFSFDRVEKIDLGTNQSREIVAENFASQLAFSLSPDDRTLVYSIPDGDDYALRLLDLNSEAGSILLTKSEGLPIMPKFSADGAWVYYCEHDTSEQAQLKRIWSNGGAPETLRPSFWNWNAPRTELHLIHRIAGEQAPVRISITDEQGHPIVPDNTRIHSEGQHGTVFFHTDGELRMMVPAGKIHIQSVGGFHTPLARTSIEVKGASNTVSIDLDRIWDPRAHGWYAADNHFHLNYGGTYRLDPEDILLELQAEGIDMGYPLLANLGNRFLEQDLWGYSHNGPINIHIGQEVRSHFLGHLGLTGINELYWPWTWGPGYDVRAGDDRTNASVMRHAREHGGLGSYVHPVSRRDPFSESGIRSIPVELVPDAVMGQVDLIELACLWTDEIGTATLWHQLLNFGLPIGLSAGSDVMNDLYRTMAIGAARVYVHPDGELNDRSYHQALKAGRSFVSTGPQIVFRVNDHISGDVLADTGTVQWELNIHSPVAYQTIELFVNGEIAHTQSIEGQAGSTKLQGQIQLPKAGWITARVTGEPTGWPVLDSYPFAECAPIWIGAKGSTLPHHRKQAAIHLLKVMDSAEKELKEGYGEQPIPLLDAQFSAARKKLEEAAN